MADIQTDAFGWYSLFAFGGSTGSDEDTIKLNHAVLEYALTYIDNQGGGIIVIPPGASYGWQQQDKTTYPKLKHRRSDIAIIDSSECLPTPDVKRAGMQIRFFFHTADETGGSHNGNGIRIQSSYNPYIYFSNDGKENKAATVYFADQGVAKWAIGQGSVNSASSDNFAISNTITNIMALTEVAGIHFVEWSTDNFTVNRRGNGFFKEGVSGNVITPETPRPPNTANFPLAIGTMLFDTTLQPQRPIWYRGNDQWVDATGEIV